MGYPNRQVVRDNLCPQLARSNVKMGSNPATGQILHL